MSEENEVIQEPIAHEPTEQEQPKADAPKALTFEDAKKYVLLAWSTAGVCRGFLSRISELKAKGDTDGIMKIINGEIDDANTCADIGLAAIDCMFDRYGVPSPKDDAKLKHLGVLMVCDIMARQRVHEELEGKLGEKKPIEKKEATDGV